MTSFYHTQPNSLSSYPAPSMVRVCQGSDLRIERRRKHALLGQLFSHPYRSYMLAFAAAIALSAGTAWGETTLPEVQQQGNVSFIFGGIGEGETEALEAVKDDYNLRITSADQSGHYRGDTRVIVSDLKGNPLLDVITDGPLLYTNLPNGRYVVQGESEGQYKKQTVRIAKGKPARVHFSWPQTAEEITHPTGE